MLHPQTYHGELHLKQSYELVTKPKLTNKLTTESYDHIHNKLHKSQPTKARQDIIMMLRSWIISYRNNKMQHVIVRALAHWASLIPSKHKILQYLREIRSQAVGGAASLSLCIPARVLGWILRSVLVPLTVGHIGFCGVFSQNLCWLLGWIWCRWVTGWVWDR